jgi:RNA polymerase sigma-70 factor, ECF subfamily
MTDQPAGHPADDLAGCPDDELIKRLQAGDIDAFEALFVRYRTPIYRTAYGMTGDRQVAEEVLQDTFARAYQRRAILRTDVSPMGWLHKVALNLCYSRFDRRRIKADPLDGSEAGLVRDRAGEPAEVLERMELRDIVRDGIAALPAKHRSVVVLYYLHGFSLQETSRLLDVRLGTVKSRLHYALRGLRLQLEADRRFGGAYTSLPPEPAAEAEVEIR